MGVDQLADHGDSSYQTPSGVVSGIQWIPADPATVPPPGAQTVSGVERNSASRNKFTDAHVGSQQLARL
jgi:hypothetical protein